MTAPILATDIAELVRLYREKGIDAADDHARVLIITRGMDGRQVHAMFTAFMREAYSEYRPTVRARVAKYDRGIADMLGHDLRAVARCLRGVQS